jgi:hypothetical protein
MNIQIGKKWTLLQKRIFSYYSEKKESTFDFGYSDLSWDNTTFCNPTILKISFLIETSMVNL